MSTYITTLKDLSNRTILPKTRTSAVYDNNNSRLDNILTNAELRITTAESDISSLKTRVTPIILGGTGATTATNARINLGLATEQGTWTPAFKCGLDEGTAVAPTYTVVYNYGKYKVIDNLVYITCHCKIEITNSGNGYARVSGLPFTATSNVDGQGFGIRECYGAIYSATNAGDSTIGIGATGAINDNTTMIVIRDASGSVQRKFKTGTLWVGFSGTYLKA